MNVQPGVIHRFDLSKEPTGVLLKWLKKARRCHSYSVRWAGDDPERRLMVSMDMGYDPTGGYGSEIPMAEIKAELAKRPHVPNKIQARQIRRLKAQGKYVKKEPAPMSNSASIIITSKNRVWEYQALRVLQSADHEGRILVLVQAIESGLYEFVRLDNNGFWASELTGTSAHTAQRVIQAGQNEIVKLGRRDYETVTDWQFKNYVVPNARYSLDREAHEAKRMERVKTAPTFVPFSPSN